MHFNKSVMFSYWVLTFNGIMRTHLIKNLTKKWRKIPTSSLNMFQKSGFCVPTQSATKSYYTHNLPIAKVFNLYGQKIIFASSHWPVSNETKFKHTACLYFNFFEHKPRQILKWGLIFHTIQNNVIHISNLMQLLLLQNNMHFLIYLVSFF